MALLAAVAAGCGGAAETEEPDPAFAEHGVPAYTGAQRWCEGNVLAADGSEVLYVVMAVPDSVGAVVSFYRERLGDEGLEQGAEDATWRFPASVPERILHVLSENAPGPHTRCEDPVPYGVRTVIVLSRILRP